MLEKSLEIPLDCKEIKSVNPKGNQSWIFIGRMDAEILIVWLLDEKNWITGKDPNAGKDWRQEEKGTIEDEMVGWYHWFNGHEFWANSGGFFTTELLEFHKSRLHWWELMGLLSSVQSLSSVLLCNPVDCRTPGLPVHHQLPEFTQTHVYWVGDAIQPSHPLSSLSPPVFNLSQH